MSAAFPVANRSDDVGTGVTLGKAAAHPATDNGGDGERTMSVVIAVMGVLMLGMVVIIVVLVQGRHQAQKDTFFLDKKLQLDHGDPETASAPGGLLGQTPRGTGGQSGVPKPKNRLKINLTDVSWDDFFVPDNRAGHGGLNHPRESSTDDVVDLGGHPGNMESTPHGEVPTTRPGGVPSYRRVSTRLDSASSFGSAADTGHDSRGRTLSRHMTDASWDNLFEYPDDCLGTEVATKFGMRESDTDEDVPAWVTRMTKQASVSSSLFRKLHGHGNNPRKTTGSQSSKFSAPDTLSGTGPGRISGRATLSAVVSSALPRQSSPLLPAGGKEASEDSDMFAEFQRRAGAEAELAKAEWQSTFPNLEKQVGDGHFE